VRRLKWLVAIPLVLIALVAGGAWAYVNVVAGEPADRLGLDDLTRSPSAAGSAGRSIDLARAGTLAVGTGSLAGYRVDEVLFGQNVTAVGRTDQVTGSLSLAGTTVSAATFAVDMASVTTDQPRRDGQFRDAIMDTARFPTATFTLTQPIGLTGIPAVGQTITASATGDLTLRGVTRSVTFDLRARPTDGGVDVSGSIPVTFTDWSIPSPSFGPASVEDAGEIEFLLRFVAGQ